MQIKNSLVLLLTLFLSLFTLNVNLHAEEFNITAKEILLDKDDEVLIGKGNVEAVDSEGNIVNADKITYTKSKEFLLAEGDVKITDNDGNILYTEKASYDKVNNIINIFVDKQIQTQHAWQASRQNHG